MKRITVFLTLIIIVTACCYPSEVPSNISKKVFEMSAEMNLDPYMCLSILIQENPEFDQEAKHRNTNGTTDVGLWQLNDYYMWTTFIGYWHFDYAFDSMNWEHSTYIAMNHIKYLSREFDGQFDKIVMAYNCGANAVIKNSIPNSTYTYLSNVKRFYEELKEGS